MTGVGVVEVALVAAAGGVGAVARDALTRRPDPVRATAVVNILGAGLLGVASASLPPGPLLVVGGGLLGSLTTFSTWMVQAVQHEARWRVVAVPLVLGVLAAVGGRVLATALGLGS